MPTTDWHIMQSKGITRQFQLFIYSRTINMHSLRPQLTVSIIHILSHLLSLSLSLSPIFTLYSLLCTHQSYFVELYDVIKLSPDNINNATSSADKSNNQLELKHILSTQILCTNCIGGRGQIEYVWLPLIEISINQFRTFCTYQPIYPLTGNRCFANIYYTTFGLIQVLVLTRHLNS